MAASVETLKTVEDVSGGDYKYGFFTDIESEFAPKGLNTDIVRFISAKKNEPDWLMPGGDETMDRRPHGQEPPGGHGACRGRGLWHRRGVRRAFRFSVRR